MNQYQVEVIRQGVFLTKMWCKAIDSVSAIQLVEKQLDLNPIPLKLDKAQLVNWTGYEFIARRM